MKKRRRVIPVPSKEAVEAEIKRLRRRKAYIKALRGTIYALIIVAALAVLISSLFMTVMQISGDSMDPALINGDIIVLLRTKRFKTGDLCSFAWNNKKLIKRIIAGPGQWVMIDEDGTVSVGEAKERLTLLDEEYIAPENKTLGENCDIEFPYQVPENCFFVLGDKRDISIDSRNKQVGCVGTEQIIGKVWIRVYPFGNMGHIK